MDTTFLFGNGIGMAIDPVYFSMSKGISYATNKLSPAEKNYILNLIPDRKFPFKEADLGQLQRTIWSCQNLSKLETNGVKWLTEEAKNFPEAFEKFKYHVACYFFNYLPSLPPFNFALFQNFMTDLINFIYLEHSKPDFHTNVNIATLNYDGLLYKELVKANVNSIPMMGKYSNTCLVDGLIDSGFREENLSKRFGNKFGYYLHLHGSPLTYENECQENRICKCSIPITKLADNKIISKDIVLTHEKHKSDIIPNSYMLSTYWRYFSNCLNESNKLIVIGYSGCDPHINQVINEYIKVKSQQIIIVIHNTTGEKKQFWDKELGADFKLLDAQNKLTNENAILILDNILTFRPTQL